jgi:small subunit ribosomal protein S20
MPNIKSAKKRVKVLATKTARNKAVKSDLRTSIKKADISTVAFSEGTSEIVSDSMRQIDRAVSKGILHKNTAARKKSRLARNINKASAQ